MNYEMAWVVIAAAGLLGSGFLFYLTHGMRTGSLKWIVRVLPALLMMVPAPVPNYPGELAPAFVVLIFESLFQTSGEPGTSGLILLATGLFGLALGLLIARLTGSKAAPAANAETS
jgi:hypothetical protein